MFRETSCADEVRSLSADFPSRVAITVQRVQDLEKPSSQKTSVFPAGFLPSQALGQI